MQKNIVKSVDSEYTIWYISQVACEKANKTVPKREQEKAEAKKIKNIKKLLTKRETTDIIFSVRCESCGHKEPWKFNSNATLKIL